MSLYNISGDPYAGEPLMPGLVSVNPINYPTLCGPLGKTGPSNINVKPGGALALPDGSVRAATGRPPVRVRTASRPSLPAARPRSSLRTGVSCMNYGDDPAFNRQHNLEGFIAMVSGRGARDPRCACDTRLPCSPRTAA